MFNIAVFLDFIHPLVFMFYSIKLWIKSRKTAIVNVREVLKQELRMYTDPNISHCYRLHNCSYEVTHSAAVRSCQNNT